MRLELKEGAKPIEGYTLVRFLGAGGFGQAWEASAPGGFRVALKFLAVDEVEGADVATIEAEALELIRNTHHPHLLDIQFALRLADYFVIATQLCDTSLEDRLKANRSGLPRDELFRYMDQLANVVDYLNKPNHRDAKGRLGGIQHRDIKPANIFLFGDSVRLADFGLAKLVVNNQASHTGRMTFQYAPPEWFSHKLTNWSDQFSLAVTYIHLRTGRLPFKGMWMYPDVDSEPDLSLLDEAERPWLARAVARTPEKRWTSCREFVDGLLATRRKTVKTSVTAPKTAPFVTRMVTTPAPVALPTVLVFNNSLDMKFVEIPAGEFFMGATDDDSDALEDEMPRQRVRVARPFLLGKFPVTQGQYRMVTGKNPSHFTGSADLPVDSVSWDEAVEFCKKLSEKEGLNPLESRGMESGAPGYRLPTEAEWEYACRGGTTTRFAPGNLEVSLVEHAWLKANSAFRTHPVGQKGPNTFGLHDMHGNVFEWCADAYDGQSDRPSSGTPQAVDRVLRGGCWFSLPRHARSSYRRREAPDSRSYHIGFRVARFVDPAGERKP